MGGRATSYDDLQENAPLNEPSASHLDNRGLDSLRDSPIFSEQHYSCIAESQRDDTPSYFPVHGEGSDKYVSTSYESDQPVQSSLHNDVQAGLWYDEPLAVVPGQIHSSESSEDSGKCELRSSKAKLTIFARSRSISVCIR